MVATAIIGSAVIGGVASTITGSQAAGAQRDAANSASQVQRDIYNSNKAMLTPWNDKGFQSYSTLNDLLGVGGNSKTMQSTLEGLPGYQFTRDQGLKSVQNGAAARGLGNSGAALKGAANYATGLANNTWGTYADRLQSSANTGVSAANALAGVGTTVGGQIGSNMIGAGNASAAAWNNAGNAIQGGANSVGQYYTLQSVLNNSATGGGAGGTGANMLDPRISYDWGYRGSNASGY